MSHAGQLIIRAVFVLAFVALTAFMTMKVVA